MALDNFKKTSMRIDKANQRFLDYQNAKVGDVNGRELLVQITNNGVVEDQTGTTLKLNWQHENGNQGYTNFNVVDIKTGKYSLYYPSEMLYKGTVDASVEINSNGRITNTMNFKIIVHADVFNGEAGVVDGVFISLADVNKKLDDREKEYVELKNRQTSVETQFNDIQQDITDKDVISAPEIIAARNGEENLKARLDKEQQEVNAQLAHTEDYIEKFSKRNIVNENDIQSLKGLLKSGEGIRYAILGDSTEAGTGHPNASAYAETNDMNYFTAQSLLGMSLMLNDENFIPVNSDVYTITEEGEGINVPLDSHQMKVSLNSEAKYSLKQKNPYKYDKLTIYFMERTNPSAAKFDVVCNGRTTTVDTYTPEVTYDITRGILRRMSKVTIDIPPTSDVDFTINNIQMVDRGDGLPTDATAVIFGFALGSGVDFINYAMGGTTLKNESMANLSKNFTTDQALQKAYDFNANVISMGWGTNDSKSGVSDIQSFKQDLMTRIDEVRAINSETIIILNTDPRGASGSEYQYNTVFNQAIRDVAILKETNLFDVEYLFDMLPSDVYADTVHPSPTGYWAMGKALCDMFKVDFFLKNSLQLHIPDKDEGQMFVVDYIPTGTSNSTDDFVNMKLLSMNRPENKFNIRVDAGFTIMQDSTYNISSFQLVIEEYAGLNLSGGIVSTITIDEKIVSIFETGMSVPKYAPVSLSGLLKSEGAQSYRLILKGKNFRLRATESKTKVSMMFF